MTQGKYVHDENREVRAFMVRFDSNLSSKTKVIINFDVHGTSISYRMNPYMVTMVVFPPLQNTSQVVSESLEKQIGKGSGSMVRSAIKIMLGTVLVIARVVFSHGKIK